ncbi:MAG: response regulator, partial [Pseudomonadota bacterium]|nr:response regulator [Pseudomonadota bacterium]
MGFAATPLETVSTAKVLVVEDDLDLREAVEDTLSLADYQVVTADNGVSALKQLAAHGDIQCVISDVNMDGMDGHELLRQIKQNYPHIPV